MPKGGRRKEGTPEEEVDEAADRMRKRPEHLRAGRDSKNWKKFLIDIGITTSEAGFWERVRVKLDVDIRPTVEFVEKMFQRSISVEYIAKRGYVIHRDITTGRFTKKIY